MSIIGSNVLAGASGQAGGGYEIERSVRFNSSDSAYLSRTPGTAGNRKTWTWAGWVKRSGLENTYKNIFSAGPNNSSGNPTNLVSIAFTDVDTLEFVAWGASTPLGNIKTSQVFRDASAWYHIVATMDTDNVTASDRIRLYVNGSRVTALSIATYPSQGSQFDVNNTQPHGIGRYVWSLDQHLSGYLADIHFIDGQALTPSSFTEVSATTGQLIPLAYTGTFGTNGFWLKFSDNSAATAAALGNDYSGNNNDWTPNNLSVTAGAGNDSLVDTPTSYGTDTGVGGEVRGNYCTWNPIAPFVGTISNGNLDWTHGSDGCVSATFGLVSGKWYWECVWSTMAGHVGIIKAGYSASRTVGEQLTSGIDWAYAPAGTKWTNNTNTSYGASFTTGDVIGVAFDADNGTLTFYKNNTSQGTAFTGLTSGPYFPSVGSGSAGTKLASINFGQRPFAYTAPSGFKALCDTNLPAPVVAKPNTVMDVALWTGNGSARSITGLAFNPDFVWIKGRSGATDHALYDAVRGVQIDLVSNSTAAETTQTQGLTAFNSDGFSLGTLAKVNTSSATYAGWTWDAGTTTASNPDGSITSQVRANVSAGFSVVTYTGGGVDGSVGHGLGVAPKIYIAKNRSAVSNWAVAYTIVDGSLDFMYLNLTNAAGNATQSVPTSTVINLQQSAGETTNGQNYVIYAFTPVVGYSNGFSYTGNGSTDGVFQYLGFRPRLILLKCSSTTGNWTLLDTSREGYNVDNDPLYPNLADAEGTTDLLDITSNGFKLRSTDASVNASAGTYIGFAWAENPFQYARAR